MSPEFLAKLAELGHTPVLIGAQRGHKTGKGGSVTKWITTPLTIVPASEAEATVQGIRDSKLWPTSGIVVMVSGSDFFKGRAVTFHPDAESCVKAIAAVKADEAKADLSKALNKLSADQLAALTAHLASQDEPTEDSTD